MNEELLEKYRDINVDYDWWDFTADMATKGIRVDAMRFTGFWSQGDGASFTGAVTDNAMFLRTHDLGEQFPWVTRALAYGVEFYPSIYWRSSLYVHENTVGVELQDTGQFTIGKGSGVDFWDIVNAEWNAALDEEYARLETCMTEIIRDYCRELYNNLKEEYEYLTSDEAVWAAIVANELNKEE